MDIRIDPEENESHALLTLAGPLAGRRVLEIGCGDGRLTWRYAAEAREVVAIDPDGERVQRALQESPAPLRQKVSFHALTLEDYAASVHHDPFDLAILSWSL